MNEKHKQLFQHLKAEEHYEKNDALYPNNVLLIRIKFT